MLHSCACARACTHTRTHARTHKQTHTGHAHKQTHAQSGLQLTSAADKMSHSIMFSFSPLRCHSALLQQCCRDKTHRHTHACTHTHTHTHTFQPPFLIPLLSKCKQSINPNVRVFIPYTCPIIRTSPTVTVSSRVEPERWNGFLRARVRVQESAEIVIVCFLSPF